MPATRIIIYQEEDGSAPLLEWQEKLPEGAQIKLQARVELLQAQGHKLRRPHCDLLEKGIYELRFRRGNTHYRVLYFFWGKAAVVLSHGLVKVARVPKAEITRALRRKAKFEKDPEGHTYRKVLR